MAHEPPVRQGEPPGGGAKVRLSFRFCLPLSASPVEPSLIKLLRRQIAQGTMGPDRVASPLSRSLTTTQ